MMRRMSSERAPSSSISFSLLPSCVELLISLAGKIITEGAFLSSAEVIICSLAGGYEAPVELPLPSGLFSCATAWNRKNKDWLFDTPFYPVGFFLNTFLSLFFKKKIPLLQASKPRAGTNGLFTEQKASSCGRHLPVLEVNPNSNPQQRWPRLALIPLMAVMP